jgi:transcriptional regulator with XRE-family HTH domain
VTIAEALDAERTRLGYSVNELARRAGVRVSVVHDILGGTTKNPGLLTAARVLAALGRSLAWLEEQTTAAQA